MEEIKLDVEIRKETGSRKLNILRRDHAVPAVIYGGKEEPTSIKFDRRVYEKIRRAHHGEVLFHLNVIDGKKKVKDYSAIVEEEQHDPVKDHVIHVDFKRISLTEKIQVKVPVASKGDPIGVKQDGGNLDHLLWELEVECLPTQIPDQLVVDVSALKIGDSIQVKDIVLPEGVVAKNDPMVMVFVVSPPMKAEEAAPAVAGEKQEPEIIGKKKPEEGEAAAPQAEAAPAEKKEKK